MKRTIIFALGLGLALSACSSGKAVGDEGLVDIEETQRLSPSPTVTKKTTKKASPTPTQPQQTQEPRDLCPDGGEIEVRIKTTCDGFQWRILGKEKKESDYKPTPFRVLQGCDVIFRNEDTSFKHSWLSGDNGAPDAGEAWKSPVLATGKTWTMDTTKIAAGFYSCHDGEVPYIVCSAEIVAPQ